MHQFTWRMVASDPVLWGTLDLSMLKSNFIKTTQEPYIYVESRSCQTLTRVLKIALNLSRGNILTLIFRYDLYVRDDQLTYTAERCPRLKRLVMPAWNLIKKSGICSAICVWKDLESLTMPAIENPAYLIEEIGFKPTVLSGLDECSDCGLGSLTEVGGAKYITLYTHRNLSTCTGNDSQGA
ncbi:unnamed protein product [Camellia sinensis]